MNNVSWKRFVAVIGLFVGVAGSAMAQPLLEMFDVNAENRVYHFYIDESIGETNAVVFKFTPNTGGITEAQVVTTLNRRDDATLTDPDWNGALNTGYWRAHPMSASGNFFTLTLPVEKTGSYDVRVRYRAGAGAWQYYGGRNPVINVSHTTTRDLVVYEMQANVQNATGNDHATRSTFKDMYDGGRMGIQYLKDLGVNCIWLQPFHPIGAKDDCNTGELGSPYSIKNLFQVAPHLGSLNTRENAMHEFTNFVKTASANGVSVIFDVIFNHVATDIEIERNPDNPALLHSNPLQEMRDIKPQWFSKYIGNHPACQVSKPSTDWGNYLYTQPAENGSQIGPAPADRNDFVWPDAFDLFWGTYPALGNIGDTTDGAWNASAEVKKMTEYYAYFIQYWIEKTGGTVGGFRCDFAQGIPRQAWQYLINKGKSIKPDLYFVSESLDGGNIAYRAWKGGFDAINENQLWAIVENNDIKTTDLRSVIDSRKQQFGLALILRGTMNHDQGPWINRKWDAVSMHSVFAAIDGTPQMYIGQELGYDNVGQFSKERVEFGRTIANIREYHNINNLWNNRNNSGNDSLWHRYKDANLGRSRAQVLRTANQYYLDQLNGGVHQQIFGVMKYENWGWDAADQEVVLAFINLKPSQAQAGTFKIDVPAVYLNPGKNYNVRNLASSTPNANLWAQGRTGADIAANGLFVSFSGNTSQEGSIAQYLKLVEQGGGGGGDTNLVWVGNTATYPAPGDIDAGEDVWVDVESFPQGAADFGSVVYSTDGVNWTTKNLATNGVIGNNDKWHANLGSFAAGSTFRFSVSLTDKAGAVMWDSNNSSNYFRTVNGAGSTNLVQWIGNTRHWPTNTAITATDDIWIDIESWPVGTASGGEVVYSSNGGVSWNLAPLTSNGQTPEPNINDWWHVNLGQFPAGTTIKYAVKIVNASNDEIWDNNGGLDFEAVVNGSSGSGSTVIWAGNTRHVPVVTPEVDATMPSNNAPVINFESLKSGSSYSVYRSTNLYNWTAVDNFVAAGSVREWIDSVATNTGYYALSGYNWPVGGSVYGGDEVVINFETYPTGTAQQVTIVYSINGNQWFTHPMSWVGTVGNNDLWLANLGTFPMGVQLQYAIQAMDVATNSIWDNNSSANFTIPIKDPNAPDTEAPLLSYAPQSTTTANATLDVTLSALDNEDANPHIFYTTNGSGPTTNSSQYLGVAITVTDAGTGVDMTIKAIAVDVSGNISPVTTIDVRVNESQQAGPSKPYSTNPSFGKRVANGGITIDGANSGEWTTNNVVALDMANDDPRSLGSNWTLHEPPIDVTHVWAAWDDTYLYLAWQFVDVTDIIDPANAGGAGSGKISSNDGILQWLVLDTIPGQGATNDVWAKLNTWAGPNKPNYQIYLAGSLWQGYISRAVNGTFAVDDGGVNYKTIAAAGITAAKGAIYAGGSELWGVGDADNRFDVGAPNRNFISEGHSGTRDSFYEMRIPLAYLGLTDVQLEANGIGIMVGAGSTSAMDTAPNDPATSNSQGVEAWNSSIEWADADIFTVPFSRIAK
jgi:glycosidase